MSAATAMIQSQRNRCRENAAPRKWTKGTVRIDIQRQGNCTKRNFGRSCHTIDEGRHISAVATAARRVNEYVAMTPGGAFESQTAANSAENKTSVRNHDPRRASTMSASSRAARNSQGKNEEANSSA